MAASVKKIKNFSKPLDGVHTLWYDKYIKSRGGNNMTKAKKIYNDTIVHANYRFAKGDYDSFGVKYAVMPVHDGDNEMLYTRTINAIKELLKSDLEAIAKMRPYISKEKNIEYTAPLIWINNGLNEYKEMLK